MLFSHHFFKKVDINTIYKEKMEGFDDKTLKVFCPLSVSSFMKKEYADNYIHDEYIESYLTSAEILAEIENERTHPNGILTALVTPKPALSITIYYLSRHSIELSIKKYIKYFGHAIKQEHNLIKIWDSFDSLISDKTSNDDKNTLYNMKKFIEDINKLDKNGTVTRYPVDKNEESNMNTFYWFNPKELVTQTRNFIQQLDTINLIDESDNKVFG